MKNKKFLKKLKKCKNPYGNGNSSIKIVDIIKKVKIDNILIDKKMSY